MNKFEFTFHNVGQGLFYTGRIGKFNFVYDCGAEKKDKDYLYKAIDGYSPNNRGEVEKPLLDVLIISHFHEDHVLGINKLLKMNKVDTVILPYLTPIERLVVSLTQYGKRPQYKLPQWYYQFLSDPVAYLRGKGIKKIVIIGGTGNKEVFPLAVDNQRNLDNMEIDFGLMPEDIDLKKEIEAYEPSWKASIKDGSLTIKNHNGIVCIKSSWELVFFNYEVDEKKLNRFRQCIEDNNLLKYGVHDIIKDVKLRIKAKNCYKELFGKNKENEFNNTSLILYHGPKGKYSLSSPSCSCSWLQLCPLSLEVTLSSIKMLHSCAVESFKGKAGQFLTGDIKVGTKWSDIEKHFNSYFLKMAVIQLPHHGSSHNWENRLLNKVNGNSNRMLYVASAGISNKHGHPSSNVIRKVSENNYFLWCNEFNSVTISGEIP